MTDPAEDETRQLLHVRYAAAALEECRLSLCESVRRAREAGVSWTRIGASLGMSAQAARRRYGHDDPRSSS